MSSLPSDHAVLFASLCAAIFMMNRTIGILIGAYCFLVVLVPRVIFGLHWPTDIALGRLVGAVLVWATYGPFTRLISSTDPAALISRHEPLFYPAMFFLSFQIATMFDSSRALVQQAIATVLP